MKQTRTIDRLEEAKAILQGFDYRNEGGFFYWLQAVGAMLKLSDSEKGFLVVYFNECRRKAERR